jgi:cell wall-associated NlpC family hydrolase
MAARMRGYWVVVLGVVLLLAGCGAPAPRRPAVAPVLPSPPSIRTPQEFALDQAISSFHGAPYRSGGTSPAGVDCSGLVQATFHQAGVNLPRTVALQYGQGQPVSLRELRFGDVIFFNRYCQTRSHTYLAGMFNPSLTQQVCHNGIYLGQGRFIHASPRGVYIGRLDAEVWRISFMGARRYLPAGPPDR